MNMNISALFGWTIARKILLLIDAILFSISSLADLIFHAALGSTPSQI